MHYRSLNEELRQRFGAKVYKLSLSAGCSCPNRDGTKGYGGCIFCSEGGSGEFATGGIKQAEVVSSPRTHNTLHYQNSDPTEYICSASCAGALDLDALRAAPCFPVPPLSVQIEEAKRRVNAKFPRATSASERKYIAYFQSFTNTYGDPDRLERLFSEALERPEIVALSIGTRPDCLPPEMVEMLSRLNRRKPVWVELGLQTIHERTARLIHRGYELPVFESAYTRLKEAGLTVVVHVILGLPGESRADMLETVRWLAALKPELDGIKLQLLHVLRGTALETLCQNNVSGQETAFKLMSLDEYCSLVVDCLKLLPAHTVVHRITGDGPKKLLIAPLWSADKKRVLNTLNRCIREA